MLACWFLVDGWLVVYSWDGLSFSSWFVEPVFEPVIVVFVTEAGILDEVAKALKIPVEAIQSFDEERAVNIISNNSFENCDQPASVFYNSTFNPIDKWVEALEENKKLYERLLQAEREKLPCLSNCCGSDFFQLHFLGVVC